MWSEAAKALGEFDGVVVTAVDPVGYPVSVRQKVPNFDPASGTFTVAWPPDLPVAEGPANVLGHFHDEKLWHIKQMLIKGRLERRADQWVFVSTEYRQPARSGIGSFWRMSRDMRRTGRRYLYRRDLGTPKVDWKTLRALRRGSSAKWGRRLL